MFNEITYSLQSMWMCSVQEDSHLCKRTGLWILPSLFNHSCIPNCAYHAVGDFMFVVTTLSVQPGDEARG